MKSALVMMMLFFAIYNGYAQTTQTTQSTQVTQPAQTAEEEILRKGVSLIRHDKFDEAIIEFNKILTANPHSVNAYYNLGFAYDKKGDLAKAIANFTKAIEIDATLTDAYYNRAFAYYKKGAFDNAITDYLKVIENSPDAADAYYGLGLVYSKKGDLDKAVAEYTKAINARPGFALAYDARAVAYVTKKNYLSALSDVNKAQALGFRSRPLRRSQGGLTGIETSSAILPDSGSAQAIREQSVTLKVAGIIFLFMSIVQLIRVLAKAKIVVNDKIIIPPWLSMIASPIMLLLAIYMFLAAR